MLCAGPVFRRQNNAYKMLLMDYDFPKKKFFCLKNYPYTLGEEDLS